MFVIVWPKLEKMQVFKILYLRTDNEDNLKIKPEVTIFFIYGKHKKLLEILKENWSAYSRSKSSLKIMLN